MRLAKTSVLALSAVLVASAATAEIPEECRAPTLSDVGWTDITATTAIAELILSALGYDPDVQVLSVPVTFEALQTGDIDIFLGNWMPLQTPIQEPLVETGTIDVVQTNLEGARVGLATTTETAEKGLRTYADIEAFEDELDGEIYSIEAGSSANATLLGMIENDQFGLGDFELVESSEQGMLAQVRRAAEGGEPVVFFGWRPHPMNVTMDMTYLSEGDDAFGPQDGSAQVLTVTRPGLSEECPNLGAFLENLVFEVEAEDVMMDSIINEGMTAEEAVRGWMTDNPDAIDRWLDGVTTVEGEPAAPAVKAELGL